MKAKRSYGTEPKSDVYHRIDAKEIRNMLSGRDIVLSVDSNLT